MNSSTYALWVSSSTLTKNLIFTVAGTVEKETCKWCTHATFFGTPTICIQAVPKFFCSVNGPQIAPSAWAIDGNAECIHTKGYPQVPILLVLWSKQNSGQCLGPGHWENGKNLLLPSEKQQLFFINQRQRKVNINFTSLPYMYFLIITSSVNLAGIKN